MRTTSDRVAKEPLTASQVRRALRRMGKAVYRTRGGPGALAPASDVRAHARRVEEHAARVAAEMEYRELSFPRYARDR